MDNGIPQEGNVLWMVLEPTVGHEQGGQYPRPVIVLSHEAHNGPSHRIVGVPCTTKGRGFITEIPIASLPKQCVALIDQITTLDWVGRHAHYRGKNVSPAELVAIKRSLRAFLML